MLPSERRSASTSRQKKLRLSSRKRAGNNTPRPRQTLQSSKSYRTRSSPRLPVGRAIPIAKTPTRTGKIAGITMAATSCTTTTRTTSARKFSGAPAVTHYRATCVWGSASSRQRWPKLLAHVTRESRHTLSATSCRIRSVMGPHCASFAKMTLCSSSTVISS